MKKQGKYQNLDYIDSILPDDIVIKRPIDPSIKIHKEMPLIFIDPDFGEFTTSIRGLTDAGKSTHPKKTAHRRALTNVTKPEEKKQLTIKKRYETMEQRGNSPNSKGRLAKRKATNISRFGVENPMQHPNVKQILKETFVAKYGVDNAMKLETSKEKLAATCIEKYGVTNGGASAQAKEKILQAHIANETAGSSTLEREMLSWVRSLGLSANKGYLGGASPKELDIKIKDQNIAIEVNGTYWHSEVFLKKHYHLEKTLLAEQQGIKLIHIFDFEWKNRNRQVKSFLKSCLGKNSVRLHARKCVVSPVEIPLAKQFLEAYHILGAPKIISAAYGLYYNNEIVSVITLGPHHRKGGAELVLNRYCGKEDVSVAGGLSRLTKCAVANHGRITTWVDRRISNGVNWEKSGWTVVNVLYPDYFYFNTRTHEIISKQSRQKSKVNTPENLTEVEHARLDNLVRVWDCGKIKLEAF